MDVQAFGAHDTIGSSKPSKNRDGTQEASMEGYFAYTTSMMQQPTPLLSAFSSDYSHTHPPAAIIPSHLSTHAWDGYVAPFAPNYTYHPDAADLYSPISDSFDVSHNSTSLFNSASLFSNESTLFNYGDYIHQHALTAEPSYVHDADQVPMQRPFITVPASVASFPFRSTTPCSPSSSLLSRYSGSYAGSGSEYTNDSEDEGAGSSVGPMRRGSRSSKSSMRRHSPYPGQDHASSSSRPSSSLGGSLPRELSALTVVSPASLEPAFEPSVKVLKTEDGTPLSSPLDQVDHADDDSDDEWDDAADASFGVRAPRTRQETVKAKPAAKPSDPALKMDTFDALAAAETSQGTLRGVRMPVAGKNPSTTGAFMPLDDKMDYTVLPTKKSRGRRPKLKADLGLLGSDDTPTPEQAAYAGMTKNGKPKKVFACGVPGCLSVYKRSEHLKRHVRSIHTGEKPFLCPHEGCGKTFSRVDNLNQHTWTHNKDGSMRRQKSRSRSRPSVSKSPSPEASDSKALPGIKPRKSIRSKKLLGESDDEYVP